MAFRDRLIGFTLASVGMVAARQASAQLSPADIGAIGVVATGTAVIERQPTTLRVQQMITAEGKTAKEALDKLKERETAARSKLAKMGVTESSVSFADPAPQEEDQRQQMQRMIQMRTGRSPKTPKAAASVKLFTTLKAEWPLKARNGDDLLLESQDIQDKVKGADLGGDKTNLTPEQQEAAEEAQGMENDNQPNPREPLFVFVSKLTDDDRDKAEAEAFHKASKEAARLAKAGGGQLGALRLIASRAAPALFNGYRGGFYDGGYRQQALYNMMNGQDEEDAPLEAVGTQPGKVAYRVTISVSYALKG